VLELLLQLGGAIAVTMAARVTNEQAAYLCVFRWSADTLEGQLKLPAVQNLSKLPICKVMMLASDRLVISEVLPLECRQVDWQGRVVRLDAGSTSRRAVIPLHG
jgi:hypothetical protein